MTNNNDTQADEDFFAALWNADGSSKHVAQAQPKIATYEEYIETLMWNIDEDSIIAELEAEYPEFAAQQHAERDANRASHGFIPGASKPEVIEDDKILIEGKNVVGATIEFQGSQWTVEKCEYISEADAADAEDGWDMSLHPGWHSWLKKVEG